MTHPACPTQWLKYEKYVAEMIVFESAWDVTSLWLIWDRITSINNYAWICHDLDGQLAYD